MTLVLELPQSVEVRVEQEANRVGVSPSEIVADLILERFAPPQPDTETQKARNAASIALLKQWLADSAADDDTNAADAEAEALEFKRNLNAPRKDAGARLLFPEADGFGRDVD